VRIGLIDGPVVTGLPEFAGALFEKTALVGVCAQTDSAACRHGTFVASMLAASRQSTAPAICPGCTFVLRPIFPEDQVFATMPTATPRTLAAAIDDCIDAGAQVINMSAATSRPSPNAEPVLRDALDRAARFGVIVVAAAGNQGTLGGSAITRHSWVIPVVACDARNYPLSYSNLGRSIGSSGLSAPGEGIVSLGPDGRMVTMEGTSVAAPFVTGAIALLWSAFPRASAGLIRAAILPARRPGVVPPLLDASVAYQALINSNHQGAFA
jgi:subtilisin family serine protease